MWCLLWCLLQLNYSCLKGARAFAHPMPRSSNDRKKAATVTWPWEGGAKKGGINSANRRCFGLPAGTEKRK